MLYGFCILDNPYSAVEIYASMEEHSLNFALKRRVLDKLGIYQNEAFLVTDSYPKRLLTFLRIQIAADNEEAVSEAFLLRAGYYHNFSVVSHSQHVFCVL